MISSIFHVLRRRGIFALFSAIVGGVSAAIGRLIGRQFLQRQIYDYRMWLDLDDPGISRGLLLFGNRELEHREMLSQIVCPGMTIFDVGANIGYYAIMESKLVGETGRVVAVEPSHTNVELLKRNLHLNSINNVKVISGAISDKVGVAKFHLSYQSNLNTFHDVGSGREHLSGETIDVETQTVTNLAEKFGAPDLIRMDVEGHEVAVLNGAMAAIGSGKIRPSVIFETHLSRYSATNDMAAVLKRMFELGYVITLAASSWEGGSKIVESLGYTSQMTIRTDGNLRKIFADISNDDAIRLICKTGGLRTVVLANKA